jgi:hypothetical protein
VDLAFELVLAGSFDAADDLGLVVRREAVEERFDEVSVQFHEGLRVLGSRSDAPVLLRVDSRRRR